MAKYGDYVNIHLYREINHDTCTVEYCAFMIVFREYLLRSGNPGVPF